MRVTLPLALLLCAIPAAAQVGGRPWSRHTIDAGSRGADGVKLGDLNGDGLVDVVTGWEEGGRIRAYLNPGPHAATGRWPLLEAGAVGSPEDAIPVDLDGDGAVDLVSACEGETRALFVHWAPLDGAQRWQTRQLSAAPAGQMWMQVAALQLDGLHGPDLVVGSKGPDAQVGWLSTPADPRELGGWRFHPLTPAGWVMTIEPVDLDGDGHPDLVVSDRRGPERGVYWLRNPGPAQNRAGAPWTRHAIGAADREVMFVEVADLDRDGRAEVIAALKPAGVAVFRQGEAPTGPWVEERWELPREGIGTAKAVHAGDVDLDGRIDLVLSFEEAHGARSGLVWAPLLPGRPYATGPLREVSGPAGVKYDLVELLDLDGDGDLDLLTTEEVDGLGVVWYRNPTR